MSYEITYAKEQLKMLSDEQLGVAFYNVTGKNYDCWNEIIPLAVKHLALIQQLSDGWHAESKSKTVWCWSVVDDDILRAIACCLILVLQDKE